MSLDDKFSYSDSYSSDEYMDEYPVPIFPDLILGTSTAVLAYSGSGDLRVSSGSGSYSDEEA